MVLVVGSTGMLGSEICYRLATKGIPIRALVRQTSDPARVDLLKKYGAVLAQGDLRDPASITAACEGSHSIICTATALNAYQPGENDFQTVDLQGVTNLIQAAEQADVSHFIYISISGRQVVDFPLQAAKRSVERRLVSSGLTYTILRPGFFMETWLPQPASALQPASAAQPLAVRGIGGRIQIYGRGNQPIRWISMKDVALLAVLSLQKPAAYNAILEAGGPDALSPNQVIEMLEKATGRVWDINKITVETLERQFQSAVDPLQQTIIGFMLWYAAGSDPMERCAATRILLARLTTVSEYFSQGIVTGEKQEACG